MTQANEQLAQAPRAPVVAAAIRAQLALDRIEHSLAVAAAVAELAERGWKYDA